MKSTSLIAIVAVLLAPALGLAHVHLTESTPADGSVVKSAPTAIVLRFSAATQLLTLRIRRSDRSAEHALGPLPQLPGQQFTIAAPQLSPGVYTVSYRARSAKDGHPATGRFSFTLTADGPAGRAKDTRNIGTRPAPGTTP